ncbi:MAG: insulinase family protein [Deltaproteobacteria bacterium]|nr:insulinase family protein [Deltaproteobacteria bacterium]
MDQKVDIRILDNGLQVMLKEIHTAPIVSTWIWYKVGSKDELPGQTGISHWVEHMQFKGTPNFPGGNLDRVISRDGGFWNAFTFLDWTTYLATMPSDKVDLILQLEADRMVNSIYDTEEVELERTVVISERQGNENNPNFKLDEEVQAAAFRVHPYHHEVIGDMVDLEKISRGQLYGHYKKYYQPNNAILVIAGDFVTKEMFNRIKELFGSIPAGEPIERINRPEPQQKGERRVTVEGPGETAFLQVTYHAPDTKSEDFFALTALDSLLSGPSNLNLFGGGISNKTSRLYREIVEKELAVGVAGGLQATIDPFLYSISFTIHQQSSPEQVIEKLDEQIDIIQNELVSEGSLERAVKQARALFAYGSESVTNQGFWMGFSEMFDKYDWFTNYIERLAKVTPEDVQRVARQYLKKQNRVIGIYYPTGNNGGGK